MKLSVSLVWVAPLLALATPPVGAQNLHFEDATTPMGLDFLHLPHFKTFGMSGGAAAFDMDGDGDDDIFASSGNGAHRLFRNDGGTFTDVTLGSGLVGLPMNTMGVVVGDYDQDGRPDLYLTNNGPNQLFRNLGPDAQGQVAFAEVAAAVGVQGKNDWSTSGAFADFDRDGDLELYVGNYIQSFNFPYHHGDPNNLFVDEGTPQSPHYRDVAAELGVLDIGIFGRDKHPELFFICPTGRPAAGCALSVCTLDYDQDGYPDLMVGNDFGEFVLPDRMWHNETRPGRPLEFRDVSSETGFDSPPQYNMGVNGADYDHDGDWDFYLSNLGKNALLRNDGGVFHDAVDHAGPTEWYNDAGTLYLTSWASVWADFDNDGWEDLVVTNGYIPAASFIANDARAPNNLWMNDRDGTFTRVAHAVSGLADKGVGRGLSFLDANRDGLIDLYLVNNTALGIPGDKSRLYLNEGTLGNPANRWLELRLRGDTSNTEALGARVEAEVGGDTLMRQVLGDTVYLSSSSRLVHFGLGAAQTVDKLTVHWPSGIVQALYDMPSNVYLELDEPRVTAEGTRGATYKSNKLTLSIDALNRTDQPQIAVAFFELRDEQTGLTLVQGSKLGSVAPNRSTVLSKQYFLSTALHNQIQGRLVVQRTTVWAAGTFDTEEATFRLP